MKKPRIIILMHYMELGGAEMALLGLLGALDTEKVDVDLFVYSHQGPLMNYIPDNINLLPEIGSYSVIERPMSEALRKGYLGIVWGRLMAKWQHSCYRHKHHANGDDWAIMQYIGDSVTRWLPKINPGVEYDLCISFLTPHNIGRDNVRANRRLAWIHTDYGMVSVNVDRELPVWSEYDAIASISDEVTRSFLHTFPSLESKIVPIENILPDKYVKARSEEFKVTLESGIKLLTIGRYTYQKNLENIPFICRELMRILSIAKFDYGQKKEKMHRHSHSMSEYGIADLKWYIIGYGGGEALIREKIAEAGMEEHVILLGKKDNPYPYIKACDIYVQPSRYEGKSVTVREAQMLQKPVAVTAYPTAASQINDGVDGVIVPLDNDGCAEGLAKFIDDVGLQQRIVGYLKSHDYANASEVEKIYELLK